MATTPTVSVQTAPQQPPLDAANAAEMAAEQALVATAQEPGEGDYMQLSPAVTRLPVELDVAIPVRGFRVRHLLALDPGQIIETEWGHGSDMPLAAGEVQLAWSEFEVVEQQLAVRVTRLV